MANEKLRAALDKLAANKAAALTGALALAMGMVVGVRIDKDDPQRDVKLEALGESIGRGSAVMKTPELAVDTVAYAEAIEKIRAEDPSAVDLMSPSALPGTEVAASVTLPLGAKLVGEVEIVGPAKTWAVLDTSCVDMPAATDAGVTSGGTWCTVRARNDGTEAQRFIAFIHYEAPP